jgi:hypothetical protein
VRADTVFYRFRAAKVANCIVCLMSSSLFLKICQICKCALIHLRCACAALSEDVEFVPIQGHNPDLVLLDAAGDEVERINLESLTRDQCNELLIRNGFDHKPNAPLDRGEL